jgi:polar amino acid transport system substrate-binding protein
MKIHMVLLECAVAVAALSACSRQQAPADPNLQEATQVAQNATAQVTQDDSWKKVLAAKKLVLGFDDAFPPMGFRDDKNEITGYDIDLATEVCKRLGIQLLPQPIEWTSNEQELNTGKIDCIWSGFTITHDRENAILYSPPYLTNAQMIVVKEDSPIKTLANLKGKTIATQENSSSVDALNAHPAFKATLKNVIQEQDFLTALMDLDKPGTDIDAVLIDIVVANYNIAKSHMNLRMLDENLGAEKFGIGFRRSDKALCQKVWDTLLAMAQDGTVKAITTKWFGADISAIGK